MGNATINSPPEFVGETVSAGGVEEAGCDEPGGVGGGEANSGGGAAGEYAGGDSGSVVALVI